MSKRAAYYQVFFYWLAFATDRRLGTLKLHLRSAIKYQVLQLLSNRTM